jgi:hypothetical protein
MPTFHRELLLGAVEQAIAAGKPRHEERQAKAAEAYEQDRQAWIDAYGHLWLDAVTSIRRKIRRGDPVLASDLPGTNRYSRSPDVFSSSPPSRTEYTPSYELVMLRDVLTSLADPKVSTSALRDLGVTAAALRAALGHLGK